MLSPNDKLDHYLSLASSATGSAAADLILRATADPHLHVFSELLALPNIAALAGDPQTAAHHALLLLFAHETFSDYARRPGDFPPLSAAHLVKLRVLSLVSLSSGRSSIPYDELVPALGVASVRELEQFVLDAGYSGLVVARLDQRAGRVLVSSTSARDVDLRECSADVANIKAVLQNWKDNSARLLAAIDQQIVYVTAETARKGREAAANEAAQKQVRDAVTVAGGGKRPYLTPRDTGAFGSFGAAGSGAPNDLFEHIEGDPRVAGSRRFDRRLNNLRSTRSKFQS